MSTVYRPVETAIAKRPPPASRYLGVLLVAYGVCLAEPARAQDAGGTHESLSFVDTFDTFKRSRWNISDGWSNGPGQDCTWAATNAKLTDKSLDLVLDDRRTTQRAYSCAEVSSRRLYGYGTYEVRLRPPTASGVITTFFTYTGETDGKGRPYEQISFEFLNSDPAGVLLNVNAGKSGNNLQSVSLPFKYAFASNDYAFQWLPDRVRWYVNRKLVREVVATADKPVPAYAGHIIFSIRNGTGQDDVWLGPFQYGTSPLVASIELVAYTKAGAACQFPESIVCTQTRVGN
jgi:endo-1,3-1,4-beta-glycanase ExoK